MSNVNYLGAVYKMPDEEFKVQIDFAPWMPTDDTITTLTVTATDSSTDEVAAVTGAQTSGDQSVTFVVTGGAASHAYYVSAHITTADGSEWTAYFVMHVETQR